MTLRCACCGERHEGLPHIAFDSPVYLRHVPPAERADRVALTDNHGRIDDDFFIRGVVEIPVHGEDAPLRIEVWVTQQRDNYEAFRAAPEDSDLGPFFGWLSNAFAFEGAPVINLKTLAHFRGQGQLPAIALEPTGHPFARAQAEGISLERAWAFFHAVDDATRAPTNGSRHGRPE